MKKTFRLKSRGEESRRYHLGQTPCGNCQSYTHGGCRPRLDGILCSCTCERSQISRAQYERKATAAITAGLPVPTIEEALEILHPQYKQRT